MLVYFCHTTYSFYFIDLLELKRAYPKLYAWNQSAITDCLHLLVFAAWDTYIADRINKQFDLTNTIRGFKNEGWENYRQMLLSSYPQKDAEVNFNHAAKQAYIAFSHAIVAAVFEEVDSTPLEGFDKDYIVRIALSSTMDVELHKKVFLKFLKLI